METYAVENVTKLRPQAPQSSDILTDILRRGAQSLLQQAIEAEVQAYMSQVNPLEAPVAAIRNGYSPERTIQTGIGDVAVRQPRTRVKKGFEGIEHFSSKILPPYLRRTKSLEELIPWLYLKGISTGDFQEALQALLGESAPGLSATTITRMKASWTADYETWMKRDLSGKRYVYIWADGVHFNVRLGEDGERACILVIMGATADGDKELLAVEQGMRESTTAWKGLLLQLKRQGLTTPPELAIGDC
jgi:transposase-like protein